MQKLSEIIEHREKFFMFATNGGFIYVQQQKCKFFIVQILCLQDFKKIISRIILKKFVSIFRVAFTNTRTIALRVNK